MTVYPTSTKVYVYIAGAWSDITANVIYDITISRGIKSSSPTERIATVGTMNFTLNNKSGLYSPDGPSALSGWRSGLPCKFEVTFEAIAHVVFYGRITKLNLSSASLSLRTVGVTVSDWLEQAVTYPLLSYEFDTDLRGDQVLGLITYPMPIQPLATEMSEGINTFSTVFDTVRARTKAYTELSKIAISELGYIYVRRHREDGEILTFENAYDRVGTRVISSMPLELAVCGFVLMETGDVLLLETGDNIVLDEVDIAEFSESMALLNVDYGSSIINRFTATAYPRKVDTSNQVLFTLNTPIQMNVGETKIYRASYADAYGNPASGKNMVVPVITTDYLMNTLEDGSGTNVSSSLVITADYGVEGVTYSLRNTTTAVAYITHLQARGIGIYLYNPIEFADEDLVSISNYGYVSDSFDQKYQTDLLYGSHEARRLVFLYKDPRTFLTKMTFFPNRNNPLMQAYLNLDIGDLISVLESETGIVNYYYIQAINTTHKPGGFANVTWALLEAPSLESGGLTQKQVDIESGATDATVIDFSYLPELQSTERSVAINFNVGNTGAYHSFLIGCSDASSTGGWAVGVTIDLRFSFEEWSPGGYLRQYKSGLLSFDTLYRGCVVWTDSDLGIVPVFYLDGVATAWSTTYVNASIPLASTIGIPLLIGNGRSPGLPTEHRKFYGKIKRPAVWNRIITAAEALSDYQTNIIRDGLVFQGLCVRTEDAAETTASRLIDNVYGRVGLVTDLPTLSAV